MKKLFIGILALGFLSSCNSDNVSNQSEEEAAPSTVSNLVKRGCPSEEIRQAALNSNPELRQRFAKIEANTERFSEDLKLGKVLADGTVEIPVIVNVLYRTAAENISDAQIQSQINTLNADYSATNSDINNIPAEFTSVAAGNTGVKFRLVTVNRKSTTVRSWRTNDAMKKTSSKGIDATNPTNYLNIWVVGDMGGILGYATFPESAGLWNDGVVIAAKYFGNTSNAPYNLGRTATHEVGHYLNLRHIWGDANCGNDLVADTPTQTGANYGKPTYPLYNTCTGVQRSVMFMNYMDYVDDAAMFMFSAGQKTRMQSVVASSGARSGLRVY
ncbi:zinc metalloprotease [Chryseobacterium gambrini]|uniref:Zinc metalloprotease n=1 Tax=Chryseobacterium gambrini TaxID=373672 RepID=A0AAJ1R653_9FLAO|nr:MULTISPECIES: zinc metalloprotease [Chryseobacterium]MDN4013780.1 zinc metalloprotease [Chryseobacterium gambrini]MDN4031105.1 zinc metalloprotease [Chryseobacterium gambrini]QWA37614.1 zinc metalloprotease [Chryseobacterium sp. ZHDP1]